MNIWMALGLSVLAIYRLSYLIAKEDGPFDLFIALRHRAGQHNWFGRGLHCVLCISFWISFLPAFWLFWSRPVNVVVGWFGIAGGVLILYKVLDEQFT